MMDERSDTTITDAMVLGACLSSRDAYERVREHVDPEAELSPMAGFWWSLIGQWYQQDNQATSVDRKILLQRGKKRAPHAHVDTMLGYFETIPETPSPQNVVAHVLEIKRGAIGNQLAMLSNAPAEEVLPVAQLYVELLSAETLESQETWKEAEGDEDLERMQDRTQGYKLLPSTLHSRTHAGAGPGDHIVIFGATEIGKSTFTVNLVAGFLRQGAKVLYVSNEDAAWKIRGRVRGNLAGMTREQMEKNPQAAKSRSEAKGMGLLYSGNMDPGDVAQIEKKLDEVDADVVVIDQARNLRATVGKSSNITQRMDQVAQEVRSLLIRRQVLGVSVVQAHAGEHGKPSVWYHADDVDSSRVGFPAQADLLIGIGATDEMQAQGVRAISICKNKLGDSKEGFTCEFDLLRSRCR